MKRLSDYMPADGDILTGPFAKDRTPHSAVILHIVGNDVYMFSISSKEDTHDKFLDADPCAVVDLTEDERTEIFGSRKDKKKISFIYCGEDNLQEETIFSLQTRVFDNEAELIGKASEDLMSRITFGVYNSVTITPKQKKDILGLRK